MPRTARLDAPGLLHHVMIRGIEGRRIFRNNKDREDFIERLEKLCPEMQITCYAWAFMSNHAHFLFRTGSKSLSTFMRRLLTGYVIAFNRRHKRKGQLFQNRYKSIICQEDTYLLELVRYIHLNPIRAGIVNSLEELINLKYSGHGALMGHMTIEWQDTDHILDHFGKYKNKARQKYELFIEEGLKQGKKSELTGGGLIRSLGGWVEAKEVLKGSSHIMSDERILGDSDFVEIIISQSEDEYERKYRLKRKGFDLDKIADRVAQVLEIEKDEVYSKGRQARKVKARSLFSFWASRELGIPHTVLAKRFGLSKGNISVSVERGETIAKAGKYTLE